MNLYWVSLLIQDTDKSKPWLCAMTDGCTSLDRAMDVISSCRKKYRVLSAWVDTFNSKNNKNTVFHECYVNSCGMIKQ